MSQLYCGDGFLLSPHESNQMKYEKFQVYLVSCLCFDYSYPTRMSDSLTIFCFNFVQSKYMYKLLSGVGDENV